MTLRLLRHALHNLNWASPPPCCFVWPVVFGALVALALFAFFVWLIER